MKTELVAQKGKLHSRAFNLDEGDQVVIGRGEDADIQVFDGGLSRRHCCLAREGDSFVIRDLNSRNGTWVNGIRVEEATLKAGDSVQLGGIAFEFRAEPERRRQKANLIAAFPESSGKEFKSRLELDESDLMELPPEFQSLENYKRVQRDLSTIYRIGNVIHAETEPRQLYQRIVDAIFDVISADRCYLLLETPDRQRLEVVAMRANEQAASSENGKDQPSFSKTIVSEVYRNGVSVLRSDALTDGRFNESESIVLQDIRSVMCVPLESQERCMGAIYVDTVGRSQAFQRHDLELLTAIARQAGIAVERAQLLNDIRELFHGTVRALIATIEAKDKYTRGHSERVTEYALVVGQTMALGPEDREALELAGLLHDIGKIGVSYPILNKPGALNEEERDVIRQHPVMGATIIANIKSTTLVVQVVRHHHECWDGSGYPDGLAGEKVPLLARILSVADAFDAMTSERPYRAALSVEHATNELRAKAGTQFDPDVVATFLRQIEEGKIRT